jgi:hypothetical protein
LSFSSSGAAFLSAIAFICSMVIVGCTPGVLGAAATAGFAVLAA